MLSTSNKMSGGKTNSRILDTSSDWRRWIATVKSIAKTGFDVWDLINPDLTEIPQQPIEPVAPEYSNFAANATTYTALSADQREEYKMTYQRFKDIHLTRYHNQINKLDSINQLIENTVSDRNKAYIEDKFTVWAKLVALKSRFAPADYVRKNELANIFSQMRHYDGNQSIEHWLEKWQLIHKECKDLDMTEVQGNAPQYIFLHAISSAYSGWANAYQLELNRQQKAGSITTTIDDIIEEFRQHLRYSNSLQSNNNGSFATFKGHESNENGDRKAKDRPPFDPSRPCACGRVGHGLSRCFELNSQIRPEGWTSSKQKIENIAKKAEESIRLRKALEERYASEWDRIRKEVKTSKSESKASDPSKRNESKASDGKSIGSFATHISVGNGFFTPQQASLSKYLYLSPYYR